MNNRSLQCATKKPDMIEPENTEEDFDYIILPPNSEIRLRGCCYLILDSGSFEMCDPLDDDFVEIHKGFVNSPFISIRAGKLGCNLTLVRQKPEQKG